MQRRRGRRAGGVSEDGAAVHVEVHAGTVADPAPGAATAASLLVNGSVLRGKLFKYTLGPPLSLHVFFTFL